MLIDQEIKKYTWNNSDYALTDESIRDYEVVVYKYFHGDNFLESDFEILFNGQSFNAHELNDLEIAGLKAFLRGKL